MDDLFSNKTTVEITVVKINNQKLTKSIVNQLDNKFPIDKNGKFYEGLKILGYVKHKISQSEEQLIFSYNNNLYYYQLWRIKELAELNISSKDYFLLKRLNFDFYQKYENKDYSVRDVENSQILIDNLSFQEFLNSEDLETFNKAIYELNEVYKKIKERLIII